MSDRFEQISESVRRLMDWIHSPEGQEANRRRIEVEKTSHNSLAYWFPRIRDAGLPVPTTVLVETGDCQLIELCDGKTPTDFDKFCQEIKEAGNQVGWPCFLRTGEGSGKHNWDRTCNLTSASEIGQHVYALVEWSECVDLCGLPYHVWAVREFLPTLPLGRLASYGNMPLCREFRFFTKSGKVACYHPYWPLEAIEQGSPDWEWEPVSGMRALEILPREVEDLTPLAERAGAACPDDDWSIDFLWTSRGWFLTDMAIAARSYHWEPCQTDSEESVRNAEPATRRWAKHSTSQSSKNRTGERT